VLQGGGEVDLAQEALGAEHGTQLGVEQIDRRHAPPRYSQARNRTRLTRRLLLFLLQFLRAKPGILGAGKRPPMLGK